MTDTLTPCPAETMARVTGSIGSNYDDAGVQHTWMRDGSATCPTCTFPAAATQLRRFWALTVPQQEKARARANAGSCTPKAWRAALDAAELPLMPDAPLAELLVNVQRTECARCGGSGHYSFNLMDGTRCYGCHGSGFVATKLGREALKQLAAWRDTIGSKPVLDLVPGDRYMSMTMSGKPKTRTVISVKVEDSTSTATINGIAQPARRYVRIESAGMSDGQYEDSAVRLALSGALWDAYVTFAATVPGALITRKAQA